jgi:hypothetical protein
MKLSIPVPRTPDGRAYRYSPNAEAYPRHFVLGDRVQAIELDDRKLSRMMQPSGSRRTVCPYSGTIGADDEFTHPNDKKAALKIVEHAFVEDAHAAVADMLSGIARKSKGVITYKSSSRKAAPRPRFGRKDLMRLLVCDHCGRDYGVFAIGLYCPDCGAPNISLHFAREVDLVSQQVELAQGLGKGKEELAYRLLGNAHEDVLTAFEATLKTIYLHARSKGSPGGSPTKPVGNDFQNIEKGQKRFAELSIDPFGALSALELDELVLNIQKRHVIGHNLGVVDAKFTQTAGSAKLGETVKLVGTDIREFAALCHKVIFWLDEWLGGQDSAAVEIEETELPQDNDASRSEVMIEDLGPLATQIAIWLCKSSTTGLPDHVNAEELVAAFPDLRSSDLSEAIAELEADGLVTTSSAIGLKIPRIHTTAEFFLTVDPIVLQTNPIADTIGLAEFVLDGRENITLADLHAESGLDLRRFNPAISTIVAEVHQGRVSQSMGEFTYPTRYFFLAAEDRVAIKRLVRQLQG